MRTASKILFLCLPEYGASNVHLAAIESLLSLHGDDVDVHLASLPGLAGRAPPNVTFHQVKGLSVMDYLVTGQDGFLNRPESTNFFSTSPTFWGYLKAVLNLPRFFAMAPAQEYLATTKEFEEVIRDVEPDVIVVDPAYAQGRDAAIASKRKVVILSPNTVAEHALAAQKEKVFNFPAPGSGLPYPLTSIWMKIQNIICILWIGLYLPFSSPVRALVRARNAAGYPGTLPTLSQEPGGPIMIVSTPALEASMIIPPDLFLVGPVLRSNSLDEKDPVVRWVGERKTVFVNLGSIGKTPLEEATTIYTALGVLLRRRPDVQVLWKLARRTTYSLPGEGQREKDTWDGRLKIVSWLHPDPSALLRSGKVICSVNHGGSNSYHEALSAGVPQVICSGWYDCHDFGSRLGRLGNGKWGNRISAPKVDVHELSRALLDVVGDKPDSATAKQYAGKAAEAAAEIRRYGEATWTKLFSDSPKGEVKVEGRDIAAEFIYRSAAGEEINGWPAKK